MNISKKTNGFEYLTAALDIQPFPQPATKLVLVVMVRHLNSKTGLCCPSVTRLMKYTGFTKRTILRAIATLRDSGILSHQKGWGNAHAKGVPNKYTFNLNRIKELAVAGDTTAPTIDEGDIYDDAGDINDTSKPMKVTLKTDAGDTTAPLTKKITEKIKPNREDDNRRDPVFLGMGAGVEPAEGKSINPTGTSNGSPSRSYAGISENVIKSSIVIEPYSNPLDDLTPEVQEMKAAREIAEEEAKWKVFRSKADCIAYVKSIAATMDESIEIVTEFLPDGYRVRVYDMAPSYRGTKLIGYVSRSGKRKTTAIGDGLYICHYGECENLSGDLSLYCEAHNYGYVSGGGND
jgi:Helix-turn-helix domain